VRSTLWRTARWIGALLVLGLVARTFVRNWAEFRNQEVQWSLHPLPLAGSVLLVWLMYALLITAWRGVLVGWGDRLGAWQAARIWTVSSLGKYVPGKVWAVAGMAMLARQEGVNGWTATASAILLQALAVGTGACVAAISGTAALESAHPGATTALAICAGLAAAGVALLMSPRVLTRALRFAISDAEPRAPRSAPVLFGVVANLIAWIGYGVSLWLLARAVLPQSALTVPIAIGAFTVSYLAGLLVLFAPGGLGVREGVFIVVLQAPLGLAGATALAVASRLLLTVTELGAAVPFLLLPRRASRDTT
jgi:glycosyltransferase 2 family protein